MMISGKRLPPLVWWTLPSDGICRRFWLNSCSYSTGCRGSRLGGRSRLRGALGGCRVLGRTEQLHKVLTKGGFFFLSLLLLLGWGSPVSSLFLFVPLGMTFNELKPDLLKFSKINNCWPKLLTKREQDVCQNSLFLNFSLKSSKGGHSNKGYSRDITPNCHNCCNLSFIHVICIYSCIYSYLLTKSIYLIAVYQHIAYLLYFFLIYW